MRADAASWPGAGRQVLHLVAGNPAGGQLAWEFVVENWAALFNAQSLP